jgi:DNA-directed RNA polymerase beta' subunit
MCGRLWGWGCGMVERRTHDESHVQLPVKKKEEKEKGLLKPKRKSTMLDVPRVSRIRELRFNVLTEEQTRRMSVTRELFDPQTHTTLPDGLSMEFGANRVSYGTVVDPRMGFDVPRRECKTCMKFMDVSSGGGGQFDCPGHFGHIVLHNPQIWLLYASELVRVLESVCPFCSKRVSRIPCRQEKTSTRGSAAAANDDASVADDAEPVDDDNDNGSLSSEDDDVSEAISAAEEEDDTDNDNDDDDDDEEAEVADMLSVHESSDLEDSDVESVEDEDEMTAPEEPAVEEDVLSDDDSGTWSDASMSDRANEDDLDVDDILHDNPKSSVNKHVPFFPTTNKAAVRAAAAAAASAAASASASAAAVAAASAAAVAAASAAAGRAQKATKKKRVSSSFYTCDCFDASCSVRFKYYCKTHPEDRSRYMEVKIMARTTTSADARGRTSRVEVSQKFIIPTSRIERILKHITRADFRQIFYAQHKDFPRTQQPLPYAPTDLLLRLLPVIPTVARPAKKLDNKSAADVVTCHYNRVIARNGVIAEVLRSSREGPDTSKKRSRVQQQQRAASASASASALASAVVAEDGVEGTIDPTGHALVSHLGSLLGVDGHLTMFCTDLWTLEGVPVGRIATKLSTDFFRADRALSTAVSAIVDKSTSTKGSQSFMNLLQRLQGKSGRFRGNLAGKRVNYTARTVITPDETIDVDEVSIPYSFARSLTLPVRVTSWNLDAVKDWVRAGDIRRIVDTQASGEEISIWCDPSDTPDKREIHATEAVRVGIVVHRYLRDGDPVIMNRQPTLHKPSMQVHRIKIRHPVEKNVKYFFGGVIRSLPDRSRLGAGQREALMDGFSTEHDNLTFGLNLSVTRPYNADFDGDEMNMHVCQTLEARAEEHELMRVDKQLGCRFIGIVQDTLIGAYLMSSTDTFVNEELMSWVFASAQGRYPELKMPSPAILKPRKMWTGKQMIGIVFQHFADAFTYGQLKDDVMSTNDEPDLFVRNGLLHAGQIKKAHFGEGGQVFSTIHTNFGSTVAAKVINHFQAIVNPWVLRRGISVGLRDCLPSKKTVQKLALVKSAFDERVAAISGTSTSEDAIIRLVSQARTDVANVVIAGAEARKNRIIDMAKSGSKGSNLNLVQIQGCLGQQIVAGRRPFADEARVYPHDSFDSHSVDVVARGYVRHSLVEGLSPREYYSHAAGGREGIIDTGIKTSRTGYSTRRMACVTEGAVVSFTGAVFNQSILQGVMTSTLYGCDGVDASKLVRCYIRLHTNPVDAIDDMYLRGIPRDHVLYKRMRDQLVRDRNLLLQVCRSRQDASESFMLPVDIPYVLVSTPLSPPSSPSSPPSCDVDSDSDRDTVSVHELFRELFHVDHKAFVVFRRNTTTHGRELNRVATRMFRIMLRTSLLSFGRAAFMTRTRFMAVIDRVHESFRKSLVDAGEPVGLIATQSLMQSTMQATLNTFHTAGTGAGAAATGGLNYFDALISVQTPKVTTTTIVLADPSKEFMIMDAVAPPVTMCDIVDHVDIHDTVAIDERRTWCVVSTGLVGTHHSALMSIDFVLSGEKMQRRCVRPSHLFAPIAGKVGGNHVDIDERRVRVYVPRAAYSRSIVEDILDVVVKRPILTPRGKNKANRGVVNARRLKTERVVIKNGNIVKETFTVIEVLGNFKLADVFSLEGVDCARTTCNDMSEVQATLGTVATRLFMFRELFRTVTGSGSTVNPRFVMQIVDYMTWTGRVEPVTRHGMKLFGPMKSAAFEQPGKVLIQAALGAKVEHMLSPTANVMFGQEIRGIGTAVVDAIPDPHFAARFMATSAAAANAAANAAAENAADSSQSSYMISAADDDNMYCPFVFPVSSTSVVTAAAAAAAAADIPHEPTEFHCAFVPSSYNNNNHKQQFIPQSAAAVVTKSQESSDEQENPFAKFA